MRTFFLVYSALFFLQKNICGQPIPACPQLTSPPADSCSAACIYCGLSSMFGSTAGYTTGPLPNFCGTIENDQWIGFVAGATAATFTAKASGCQNGDGLQLAIYDDCGGDVLSCNVGLGGGGNFAQSTGSANFIIGQTYFLVIDGYAGDICYFDLKVTPADALVQPPIGQISAIIGPDTVCKNSPEKFCVENLPNATAYQWLIPPTAKINGMPGPIVWLAAPDGHCADIQFANFGGTVICTPVNSCNQAQPKSKAVIVDCPVQVEGVFFEKNQVQIRPNPASDFVAIEFASPIFEETKLAVFDIGRRLVFSKKMKSGQSEIELETTLFPNGVYSLILENRFGVLNQKLIVIH